MCNGHQDPCQACCSGALHDWPALSMHAPMSLWTSLQQVDPGLRDGTLGRGHRRRNTGKLMLTSTSSTGCKLLPSNTHTQQGQGMGHGVNPHWGALQTALRCSHPLTHHSVTSGDHQGPLDSGRPPHLAQTTMC